MQKNLGDIHCFTFRLLVQYRVRDEEDVALKREQVPKRSGSLHLHPMSLKQNSILYIQFNFP